MAEFFFSVPGVLAAIGLGILLLSRGTGVRRATRAAAATPEEHTRLVMRVVVSAVILAAGLWVLLSGRYGADALQWASGSVGAVVGYWLKP